MSRVTKENLDYLYDVYPLSGRQTLNALMTTRARARFQPIGRASFPQLQAALDVATSQRVLPSDTPSFSLGPDRYLIGLEEVSPGGQNQPLKGLLYAEGYDYDKNVGAYDAVKLGTWLNLRGLSLRPGESGQVFEHHLVINSFRDVDAHTDEQRRWGIHVMAETVITDFLSPETVMTYGELKASAAV